MPIISNYLAVILIWSTTPLAIKLSNVSFSTHASIVLRMLLAFMLTAIVIAIFRHQSAFKLKNWRNYFFASVALFPSMPIVYLASNYIGSGLIAVLFSLTPIISGIMASIVLSEKFFNVRRVGALCLSVAGFVVIFMHNIHVDEDTITGILLMLVSNVIFCVSQVSVKYTQRFNSVDALEQTFGALIFSLPGLILCWTIFDGELPSEVLQNSVLAIVYLGVVGSLIGFVAYFFILKNLSVTLVSVIPLITPILALWLGAAILDEKITPEIMTGTLCIICALALYDGHLIQWMSKMTKRLKRAPEL